MKFVNHNHIDKERWDQLINDSPINNVMCYSWYLDATTKKWGAFIDEEYSCGLPLPYKNRGLYKKIFQHPYSRNVDFFGNNENFHALVPQLKRMGMYSFRLSKDFPSLTSKKRVYQAVDLTEEIHYKTNTKRILKKFKAEYNFECSFDNQAVEELYFNNSFHKIKQQKMNKSFFASLTKAAIDQQKGEVIQAFNSADECVAAAFFFVDKTRAYYLIGDCLPEYKKKGAMFCLLDFAVQHYRKNRYKTFDFGGSNVESVATFYRKMGGQDVTYFEYFN